MSDPVTRSRLRHGLAVLVLLAAALVCFHRLVQEPGGVLVGPQNAGQNDATANMIPWRSFLQTAWADAGTPPVWNPYGLTGIPWLGNPQSAMFYPPNWLFLVADATWLLGWLMVAHLWFGGLGVYAFCRRLDLSSPAAVLAGCAYLGAPYLVAHVGEGHYNQILVVAWMPWAFVSFLRLREGRRGGVPLTAAVFALSFFCGHVQELFYLVLIMTAWVAAEVLFPRLTGQAARPWRLLGRWCATGLATVGLVAVELLPIYSYTKQAVRATGLQVEAAAVASLDFSSLRQLWDPFVFGGPESYHGPGLLYWESVCHFGVLVGILALLGLATGWRSGWVRRLSLTAILALAFGMGMSTPLFPALFQIVPGVSFFRVPSRILFHVSLFLCVLAGFGADWMFRRLTGNSAALRWRRSLAFGFAGMLVAAVVAESTSHARQVTRVIRSAALRDDSEIVRFLRDRIGTARVIADQFLLSDREAWANGIAKLHGYDPVPLIRSATLIDALSEGRVPQRELIGLEPTFPSIYSQNLLNLAGVRYAVVPAGGPVPPSGWRRVAAGRVAPEFPLPEHETRTVAYEIWENEHALPRAFVLGATDRPKAGASNSDQLASLEGTSAVLVAADQLPPGPRQPFRPARILEYSPNRVAIEAELDAPGYLVLTDVFAAGWQADVNGRTIPVVPVDMVFRGVPLAAGRHRVVLAYRPPGMWTGGTVSVMTLLLVLYGSLHLPRRSRDGFEEPLPRAEHSTACEPATVAHSASLQ